MKTRRIEPWWKSRTVLTLLGLAIVWVQWERYRVGLLAMKTPEQTTAWAAGTQTIFYLTGLLCAWLAGIKSVEKIFAMKAEAVNQTAQTVETIIERAARPRDHEDETEPPLS